MFVSIACAANKIVADSKLSANGELVAGQAHAAHSFPPFDHTYFLSQIFWLTISFGLFYLFISRVIVPNVGRVLETRHDRIASDLDNAVRLKSDAELIVQQYEKELQDARAKFSAVLGEATNNSKLKLEQEAQETEAALAAKLSSATQNIESVKQKALKSVDDMVREILPPMLQKLINENVADAQIEKLLHKEL